MTVTRAAPGAPRATRRLPAWLALAIVAWAAVLGGVAAATQDSGPAGAYQVPFAEGSVAFCAGGGLLDHGEFTYGEEASEAYASPEEAVRAYERHVRAAASLSAYAEAAGRQPRPELVAMLEPSRRFRTTVSSRSADGALHYFDVPSAAQGVLEARVVVGTVAGRYAVLETYRCESTIATDVERFRRLWAEEVER